MASAASPTGIPSDTFLGVGSFLVVLPAFVVAARLAGNAKHVGQMKVGDYLSIVAVILLAGMFANFVLLVNALSDPTASVLYLLRLVTASGFTSGAATWAAKAPVLFLYIQVFGIKRFIRYTSYITLIVTFIFLLAWNAWLLAKSLPITPTLTAEALADRTNAGSVAGVACAILGVVADIIILVLPLLVVPKLHLPFAKKLGLTFVFLTGILGVAASAVGLYFKWLSLSGTSTDVKSAMICTVIELSIAIMVGCVPSLYTFWSSIVINTAFYSKLQTAFSQITLTRSARRSSKASTKAKSTKSSENSRQPSEAGSNHTTDRAHRYDVLDEADSGKYHAVTVVPLRDLKPSR
ncbi:putative integral membrane protein [Eutypa lata UCREL1]|uniref:Putative integral membrane protein n=1 Tax=Eutypa lata (strain UCR-EL1) TaxID=1287681 RepID=M7SV08_EUTLA|nr:putative integral membrane protein [Eutypa lata UCREL1]